MYRILTENKNRAQIESGLADICMDFTSYTGKGVWKGVEEKSLIIEFEGEIKEKVLMAAELIRKFNKQQEVLVQEIPSTVTVVK